MRCVFAARGRAAVFFTAIMFGGCMVGDATEHSTRPHWSKERARGGETQARPSEEKCERPYWLCYAWNVGTTLEPRCLDSACGLTVSRLSFAAFLCSC